MSRAPTPAKRLHDLARKHGVSISEFSPGLRVWSIRPASDPYRGAHLAFGIPQAQLADEIKRHSQTFPAK